MGDGRLNPAAQAATARAAEQAARRSYGKLLAFLAARTRDVAGAEDALSEAFASALTDWPHGGVPANPDAWLLTVARRRMIDAARSARAADAAAAHMQWLSALGDEPHDSDIPDERLALMFACAHPAMDEAVRAPLMLQTALGLDAARIAQAFLLPPATLGQRLVRAKARIRDAGVPLRVPGRAELPGRLDAVLQAIYAAWAQGWQDADGTDARRRELADEALWLATLVASLLPGQAEALGLLALMLHTEARRAARRDTAGRYVPLAGQDPAAWDHSLIDQAEALLRRAARLARESANADAGSQSAGRFQLEAAIQSAHVARRLTASTDWAAIGLLYGHLWALTGSPVVAINQAMAQVHAQAHDAARTQAAAGAALQRLDELARDSPTGRRLAAYQPWWAARAELLRLLGHSAEANQALRRAIALETDPAVQAWLRGRITPSG